MRRLEDPVKDYLRWYTEKTGDNSFSPEVYLNVDDDERKLRVAAIWKQILKLCYKKTDGIYWFTKFILGDLTYAGYPNPIVFNKLWHDWAKLVKKGDHILIRCSRQHGKEQPNSAPIITPSGWTTMGQLKTGDKVFSETGKETIITKIFEQGEKNVYKVTFTDGSSTECGLEHLWKVKGAGTGRNGKPIQWKTKSLKTIIEERGMEPKSDSAYRIPLTKPVQFKEQTHYIDPYTLGALIGDGGLTADSCIITSGDKELINTIKNNMPQLKLNKTGKCGYRLIDKKNNHKSILINELKRLKLWGITSSNKFIPNEYLLDSVDNRTELLRGLMDTDGSIHDTCIMEYYSISKILCKQIKELVQSLGGKARIDLKNGRYNNKKHVSYRVKIWLQNINPFKLKRKADKFYNIRYKPVRIFKKIELSHKEKCRCIMVDCPTHTYLTNDYIVTHNSTFWTVVQTIYRVTLFEHYNVLIESASEDQAVMLMSFIVRIIENNEFLLSKKSSGAKWSTTEIGFNGGKIVAKGVGSEVRGGTYDYIICDDILRSDNKLSDDDIERFVDEELEPMIFVRKGQIVIVGTPKSSTDIFATIEDRIRDGSKWVYNTYPAIINYEKKILLCPDRFTWEQLMAKKANMGSMKFDKEFLCKTYSSGAQIFPPEIRRRAKDLGANEVMHCYAKPKEAAHWRYYMGIDVARAGTASADYTVAIVLAYNPDTQEKRIVWYWRKKGLKIVEQVQQISEIARNFNGPIILVEQNNIGQDFIDIMIDNYNLIVESFVTGSNKAKEDLIRGLISAFENEKMIMPTGDSLSREMMEELDRELERFVIETTRAGNEIMKGSGKSHDDMVMALALANRCSQSYGYTPFAVTMDAKHTTELERFTKSNDSRDTMRFGFTRNTDDDETDKWSFIR